MLVIGALFMIGAVMWLVFATKQSNSRTAVVPSALATSSLATEEVANEEVGSGNAPEAVLVTPVASPAIPYPEIKRISLEDAKAAYDQGSAIFIDVRGEPYYSESHIPGALSITYDELASRIGELDKKALIIAYCT
jgi:hypothetical protein